MHRKVWKNILKISYKKWASFHWNSRSEHSRNSVENNCEERWLCEWLSKESTSLQVSPFRSTISLSSTVATSNLYQITLISLFMTNRQKTTEMLKACNIFSNATPKFSNYTIPIIPNYDSPISNLLMSYHKGGT